MGTAASLLGGDLEADNVTDLDEGSSDPFADRRDPLAVGVSALRKPRPCSFSAQGRPACPRRCATPIPQWATPPRTGAGSSGSGPTTGFRWPPRPRTSSDFSTCWQRRASGASVRLHRRFDLDEVLHRIEVERMTLEMAVAPIALALANHPGLEELRPLIPPLHHVGSHAGDRERGRGS